MDNWKMVNSFFLIQGDRGEKGLDGRKVRCLDDLVNNNYYL